MCPLQPSLQEEARGGDGKGTDLLLVLQLLQGLLRKREVKPWLPETPSLLLNLHFLSGVT